MNILPKSSLGITKEIFFLGTRNVKIAFIIAQKEIM